MATRKTLFIKEIIEAEGGGPALRPVSRAAAIAIIDNPFAGRFVADLSELIDLGMALGERLMPRLVGLLDGAPLGYGKSALVGVNGDLEHAAALLHPKLCKPMRAAVGGGEAIIPSTTKVGSAGMVIDVPLGNKDNVWSFDELDTMSVSVFDAPRPNEIMMVMAVSDGGRPHPRIGKGRAVT